MDKVGDLPLCSVIIPTQGRRLVLLERAIRSAVAGLAPHEIEVLVIANGVSNFDLTLINDLSNVSVVYLPEAGVSIARNHGIAISRGLTIRFLDDDDYLYPDVAGAQVKELLALKYDVSSYALEIRDEQEVLHDTLLLPDEDDFVAAQLSSRRMQVPCAHLYKRVALENVSWNESFNVSEDVVWLLKIASTREIHWLKSSSIVGVWFQHRGTRLSYAYPANLPNKIIVESILEAVAELSVTHRLMDGRKIAAADGIWFCLHRGFIFDPCYWHGIGTGISKLVPNSRPTQYLFRLPLFRSCNPLLVEWITFPVRYLILLGKGLTAFFLGWQYIRRL